ncbi:MAG: putative transcriptional regulator [Proteobacteria bacterium]|nr:putative transcriptional regulator [Pseudomonadota bacterium]
MTTVTKPFDSAQYLQTEEDIAAYLEAAFEDGDPALVAHALGVIARAQGMTKLARDTGLGRQNLYVALSEGGNPTLASFMAITKALGLAVRVEPIKSDAAE